MWWLKDLWYLWKVCCPGNFEQIPFFFLFVNFSKTAKNVKFFPFQPSISLLICISIQDNNYLLSSYYVPDLYTEIIVPDGIGSLFLCICLSFSISVLSLFFHLPLIFFFFFPLPLKQTLVGLGPSVSVFGKQFDCSVRCYKSLNRARQICICDPFP